MNTEEEVNKADVFNMAQKYANLSHEDFDGNEDLHYQKGFVAGALWQQSQSADVVEKKGMRWVKASDKLPKSTKGKISVAGRRKGDYGYDHFQIVPDDQTIYVAYKWYGRQSCPEDFEWLDENIEVGDEEIKRLRTALEQIAGMETNNKEAEGRLWSCVDIADKALNPQG